MDIIGSVMEIEKFAIHDGPGIRSTIFLQGCPLHCPWCANPESQQINTHLMYNSKKCVKCGTCVKNCPQKAITVENGQLNFDRKKCITCKTCKENCPADAISFIGERKSIEEVMESILRDKNYYEESGGGVTFSGGEPFVQFDFLINVLKKCKEYNINTAIETTGDTSWSNIEMVLPYVDLFLYDMKHSVPEKIIEITGGNGYRIQENLVKLAKEDPNKIIIRVPVIPGFNYYDNVIKDIINMALQLKIPEVNLLPYHNLGASKYDQLGKEYTLKDVKMMSKSELKHYENYGEAVGVMVKIGG